MISTPRLDLVPVGAAFLGALLRGERATAAALLDATLPDGWPDYPSDLYFHRLRLGQLEADPGLEPWLVRAMILRETRQLVGQIGCHTGPDPDYLRESAPGGVEFGFTVFEPFRRQGFAREASLALMDWARTEHGVTKFVVSISPENAPSLGLARSLGFRQVGEQMDEIDGLEWVFRLDWPGGVGADRQG
jgi:RimJ/RimL family protein N-acetyltransferase